LFSVKGCAAQAIAALCSGFAEVAIAGSSTAAIVVAPRRGANSGGLQTSVINAASKAGWIIAIASGSTGAAWLERA
jgi:hypothetical protein